MVEYNREPGSPGSGDPEEHRVPDVDDATSLFTPSQAEGDRDTVERDIADKLGGEKLDEHYDTGGGGQGDVVNTPSQAEGDRGEEDEDLREKGEG